MNGNEFYESQYKTKINNLIKNNPEKIYLTGFYNFMNSSRLSSATKYTYLNYITRFMENNQKHIEELELDDYTNFLGEISIKGQTSSYQITMYSALKKFAEYLCASKKNSENPMLYIKRPKFTESENTIKKRENGYLTEKETKKLINRINKGAGSPKAVSSQKGWKERDLLIIEIFLFTGMRCSALFKLDIDSIDFEKGILIVTDKGNKVKKYN